MSAIVRIYEQGPPSVLKIEEVDVPTPAAGQLRIVQHAIGMNYVDTHLRSGRFGVGNFPFVGGFEGAGIVDAVGTDVADFKVGDRVVFRFGPGAYSVVLNVPADRVIHLPDNVSFEQGAALLAKGLTARMFAKRLRPIGPGSTVLVHAARGGVGSLLSSWVKALGATVIGTVGSASKVADAKKAGLDHVIALDEQDFLEEVLKITNGRGVDIVFDNVGKETFDRSLKAIAPLGTVALTGWTGGAPEALNVTSLLGKSGSVVVPNLGDDIPDRASYVSAAQEVFDALEAGIFGDLTIATYPLSQIAQVHEDMENRRTSGSIVIVPEEAHTK